ncbi:hypothetical protein L7F22_006441 [Adiantum nelumboides]|nr:hypothetical protein [Adiantum nelumboides]
MLSVPYKVSWNALIGGYVQQGKSGEALCCFHRMQREGVSPDAITYACILKLRGIMQEIDIGQQMHDDIVSQGLLEKDYVLGSALVDMHAKCGVFRKVEKTFDELPVRIVA